MSDRPHVLIVGAGLTGLFVAHGLRRAGIPFTIFEREGADDSRRREWSMGIHWGLPLLESLLPPELSARLIRDAAVDPSLDYVTPPTNGSVIYDGVTGEAMKTLQSDDKLVRASRRKLRSLISEGIDIHYNHTLTALTPNQDGTITAHFASQPPRKGTLLLGADGPRSSVRNLLFAGPSGDGSGAEASLVPGIVQLSTTLTLGSADRARFVRERSHPVWSVMLHPRIYAYLCVQDASSPLPEEWKFFLYVCWRGERDESLGNAERIAEVRARAEGDGDANGESAGSRRRREDGPVMEPFRSLLSWLPDNLELPYVDASFWVAEEWDPIGGRVTLAGDAAHPMPPFRGQGLNNALQDAVNFVAMVEKVAAGKGEREGLVREYGVEVARRGAEETELTLKNGYMLIDYEKAKESPYFRQGLSKSRE